MSSFCYFCFKSFQLGETCVTSVNTLIQKISIMYFMFFSVEPIFKEVCLGLQSQQSLHSRTKCVVIESIQHPRESRQECIFQFYLEHSLPALTRRCLHVCLFFCATFLHKCPQSNFLMPISVIFKCDFTALYATLSAIRGEKAQCKMRKYISCCRIQILYFLKVSCCALRWNKTHLSSSFAPASLYRLRVCVSLCVRFCMKMLN